MRKRLLFALMANMTTAISLSLTPVLGAAELCAQSASQPRRGAATAEQSRLPAPRVFAVRNASGELLFTTEPQGEWQASAAGNLSAGGGYVRSRSAWATSMAISTPTAEIDAAIAEASARHGLDADLIRSVIRAESAFDPFAVSRKGAQGLMQLMPATAAELNVANPFDAAQNIDGGVRHLKQLLEHFGGDLQLSLAAYNAGESAVRRAGGVPDFAETRNYLRRVAGFGPRANTLPNRKNLAPARLYRDEHGVLTLSNTD